MLRVRVVTAKDYSTKALKALHRAGVLHVERSEELRPVDREAIERDRREVGELLATIDDVLAYAPEQQVVTTTESVEVIYTRPLEEIDSEVRQLCTRLINMHQRAAKLTEETDQLRGLGTHLGPLHQQVDVSLSDLSFSGAYLFSRVYVFPRETYEALHRKVKDHLLGDIAVTLENESVLYVIARVEHREAIESAVKSAGGKALQIPDEDLTLGQFLAAIGDRAHNIEEELATLRTEIGDRTKENLEKLVLFRQALSAENERLSVLEKAAEAKYVTLLEGWVPENKIEAAVYEVRDSLDYVFIDSRVPTADDEPPTSLRNPRGMKPFEVITKLFGSPKYREWDPTPIVAYSFAVFYGLMLCDVVYAIGVMLAARYVLRIFVDDPRTEGFRLFQRVLYISAGVALILGLLSGTYLGNVYNFFGIESVTLVQAVRQVVGDPITFVIAAIGIGIVHVNIAHTIALVKGIKERDKGLVVSKVGLFALQLFGIPLVLLWLFNVSLPVSSGVYAIFAYVVLASLLLVIVAAFMQHGGLGAIFWLFDLTGILGDIMSYCRLAGVGLATYYLAASFNMLAELLSGMVPGAVGAVIGVILAIIVLAFGHTINLALSGLTAFIHSLRLCFVEFLFKFYEGGGRDYSPFRLKSSVPAVVGGK